MNKKITFSLQELDQVVQVIKDLMPQHQVFTFIGPLGAGKTTVIKKLLRACGITQNITSPTFIYVNTYQNKPSRSDDNLITKLNCNGVPKKALDFLGLKNEQTFYHFDLYRIKSREEFQLNGFDEYLFQPNSWAFIEWPEVIASLLTHQICEVKLDYHQEPDKRIATITCSSNI